MMISLLIGKLAAGAIAGGGKSMIGNIIGNAIMGAGSGQNASGNLKRSADQIKKVQEAALRVTAARLRKRILGAYEKNTYNWAQQTEYSNWLGGAMGAVTVGHLRLANKPVKTMTKSGKRKKAGYSQRPINMPKPYPLGGKLARGTRYKIEKDNFTVGILPTQSKKIQNKMSAFQEGGTVGTPDQEASRRYFAALGVFYRRSTILSAKPRPLYAPLVAENPPEKMYEQVFEAMMDEKLRVGTS